MKEHTKESLCNESAHVLTMGLFHFVSLISIGTLDNIILLFTVPQPCFSLYSIAYRVFHVSTHLYLILLNCSITAHGTDC